MSALRYIKITAENNKCIVLVTLIKSSLHALLSKWNPSTVQTIMRFLVFLHTVHKKLIFCWFPSHMGIAGNETADNFAAIGKYISECLISCTDAYQYISEYLRDLWQCEWTRLLTLLFVCFEGLFHVGNRNSWLFRA